MNICDILTDLQLGSCHSTYIFIHTCTKDTFIKHMIQPSHRRTLQQICQERPLFDVLGGPGFDEIQVVWVVWFWHFESWVLFS